MERKFIKINDEGNPYYGETFLVFFEGADTYYLRGMGVQTVILKSKGLPGEEKDYVGTRPGNTLNTILSAKPITPITTEELPEKTEEMKEKYAKLEQDITLILKLVPLARDSDEALYAQLLKYRGTETTSITAQMLLQGMHNKIYPSWESVSRWRRKIQEKLPECRGLDWERKHTKEQEDTKSDLGYIYTKHGEPGTTP